MMTSLYRIIHFGGRSRNTEYDQEIPQSQTANNPVAPRGRAAQPENSARGHGINVYHRGSYEPLSVGSVQLFLRKRLVTCDCPGGGRESAHSFLHYNSSYGYQQYPHR